MPNYNMTASEYATLYRRFLERNPKELLDYGLFRPGMRVLDLCAGGGRMTDTALGADAGVVVAFDGSPILWTWDRQDSRLVKVQDNVILLKSALARQEVKHPFDLIVCQQAINHIWNPKVIDQVVDLLKPGGRFVFNTFWKKPDTERPTVKTYTLPEGMPWDGSRNYVEVVNMVDDVVHHVQICDGLPPHLTSFKWVSPDEFESVLKARFQKVGRARTRGTDIYSCMKQED